MFESKDHKNKWMYFWRKNCPAGPRAKLTFRVMIVWCNNHCALISRFTSFNERFDSSKWRDGVKMRALISPLSQGLVVLTVVGTDFQNIFIPFEIFFGRYHPGLTHRRERGFFFTFLLYYVITSKCGWYLISYDQGRHGWSYWPTILFQIRSLCKDETWHVIKVSAPLLVNQPPRITGLPEGPYSMSVLND